MATYNKRGFKAPKPKEVVDDIEENVDIDTQDDFEYAEFLLNKKLNDSISNEY